MTSYIVTCGFQPVKINIFRDKTLNKGKKLVDSYHVSDVKEIQNSYFRRISGTVLRETPGAHSNKKNTNVYKPVIELNSNREVIDTDCNCKGGKGYCKHAAAICLYVNLENTCSKTDQPMIWNRPPQVQLDKYHKGSTIEALFPHAKGNRDNHPYTFQDFKNLTPALVSENTLQSIILQAELKCNTEKECRIKEKEEKEKELKICLKKLYNNQNNTKNQFFVMSCEILEKEKLKFSVRKAHKHNKYYCDSVVVDEDQWLKISIKSVGQSASSIWHKERFIRITASSRAHKIKTRKDNFEKLAKSFINEKNQCFSLIPALRYGIEMENEARQKFVESSNLVVQEVGLIISSKQPYFACSPDGIILNENGYELLEIKCPYVCNKSPIIDMQREKIIAVSYLEFDKYGKLNLKKNDKYYTQIQMSLYILSLEICHFYVYSQIDQYEIIVSRDDEFLSSLIPKIEGFYFGWYLPLLQSESDI